MKIIDLPLTEEEQIQGIGIAIKKNNQILAKQIQQAINNLEKNGIISELEKKWNLVS
ncbi:transporter substrate-binding domain-containing protein [Candidatus Dependentiae bacterium]|nr:transporter substrate-binding domain-containing protein [Candidatus Dependentiae bacterium]